MGSSLFRPDLVSLCRLLNRHRVRYLVIGGQAAIFHGLPRTTIDVDIFIEGAATNAQRLIDALRNIGFGIAKELTPDEILARHVFQFADQIRIDIFLKPWGLSSFAESYRRRRVFVADKVRIPVVSLDDLVRSKETDRVQDREDRRALLELRKRMKR